MSDYNVCRTSGSRLILVILILGIMLTACGDQNTSVTSQGAVAVATQITPKQAATTLPSAKVTPKPATTTAKVATGVLHICSLLTKDEVAASLGGTVAVDAASDSLGEFGQATCNYTNSSGGLTVQVSITGQSKADFENTFKTLGGQAVPGLGDVAFFTGGQLSTLKGKVGVVIFLVNPANGADTLSNATDLTNKVLTALGKSNHASDVTSAAATGNSVTAADIPVYPGSVQVENRAAFGTQLATFTSTDDYATIVSWFKKIIADKSWTGTAALEPEADYTVISAGKATADTSSQLLVSIEGPKKADRGTISDNNGNPVVLNPNDTLIVVTLR